MTAIPEVPPGHMLCRDSARNYFTRRIESQRIQDAASVRFPSPFRRPRQRPELWDGEEAVYELGSPVPIILRGGA
jgi:hypothetical protein